MIEIPLILCTDASSPPLKKIPSPISCSVGRGLGSTLYRKKLVLGRRVGADHCTSLGNCPPTPPVSQHFALSEKQAECKYWLGEG